MGIVALLAGIAGLLQATGVLKNQGTVDLLTRIGGIAENIVMSIIKNKREPTPEEVAAMHVALDAGDERWKQIMGDWN
jgi:plasmid maintenance system antidote protein VapI